MKRIGKFLAIWAGVVLALMGLALLTAIVDPAIVWLGVFTFISALIVAAAMDI